MTNQSPEGRAPHDLDELETLPADLQPLYQQLSDDGAAWQAASAGKIAALAQALVTDVERMTSERSNLTPVLAPTRRGEPESGLPPLSTSSTGGGKIAPRHQHRRVAEWIVGTVAAVAVVALLAFMLQGALVGRGNSGPTNPAITARAGRWQVLDKLTVKSRSVATQPAIVAPGNPQVAYEATNSISGEGGKAVTYASLRRTVDGGATWDAVKLPLPLSNISTIQLQVSPVSDRIVFLSLWDRTSITCEPTNGTVGEGCERGYVSYDSGATWQTQQLPVRGILDLNQPIVAQQNRMFASNDCNEMSCIHLLMSADGGQSWQVVDGQLTSHGQHVCNFVATPNAGKVYAMTAAATNLAPQPACSLPASAMSLWRSDDAGSHPGSNDAGTHWMALGPAPTRTQTQASSPHDTPPFASLLAAPVAGVVYLNVSHWSEGSNSAAGSSTTTPVLISEDDGVTWRPTPAIPVSPESPLESRSAAALHDGSVAFAIGTGRGGVSVYTWRPGDAAWSRLPALPVTATGVGMMMSVPVGSWKNSLLLTLRQTPSPDTANYYIVRYQT